MNSFLGFDGAEIVCSVNGSDTCCKRFVTSSYSYVIHVTTICFSEC